MQIKVRRVDWERKSVFRIAYRTQTHAQTIQLELHDGPFTGRSEALGVSYHGESMDTLLEQITDVSRRVEVGISREELRQLLPAGGARNAFDCALWDLEAKQRGKRVWELAGLTEPKELVTTYTLGLDSPAAMADAAAEARIYSHLKIKLSGEQDLERLTLIRRARPDVSLVVDANQAWTMAQLQELSPKLVALGVRLIEQPLPAGNDDALLNYRSDIPLCADESCQTSESLPALLGKYEYINIKLDKTGGLTEALRLARLAREAGLKLMVGCMGGSSLAMAPAFVVGQLCDLVDLDSPLLIKQDVPHGIAYEGCKMSVPAAALWG